MGSKLAACLRAPASQVWHTLSAHGEFVFVPRNLITEHANFHKACSPWYGMANDTFAGLDDIALPDLDELQIQIPGDFTFSAFDEAGLLGDPPNLIVNNEAGVQQTDLPGLDHLSWLPTTASEGHSQASQGATTSADHDQQHARPGPAQTAAGPKGRFERKAEQNRCAADSCNAGRQQRRLRSRTVTMRITARGLR